MINMPLTKYLLCQQSWAATDFISINNSFVRDTGPPPIIIIILPWGPSHRITYNHSFTRYSLSSSPQFVHFLAIIINVKQGTGYLRRKCRGYRRGARDFFLLSIVINTSLFNYLFENVYLLLESGPCSIVIENLNKHQYRTRRQHALWKIMRAHHYEVNMLLS